MAKEYYIHENVNLVCTNGIAVQKVGITEEKRPVRIAGYIQANHLDRFGLFGCKYALILAALALGMMSNPAGWVLLAAVIAIIVALGLCALATVMSDWNNMKISVKVYKGSYSLTHKSFMSCPVMNGTIKPFFSVGAAWTQQGIQDVFVVAEMCLAFVGGKGLAGSSAIGYFANIAGGMGLAYVVDEGVVKPLRNKLGYTNMMDVGEDDDHSTKPGAHGVGGQETIPLNKDHDSYSVYDEASKDEALQEKKSSEKIEGESREAGKEEVRNERDNTKAEAKRAGDEAVKNDQDRIGRESKKSGDEAVKNDQDRIDRESKKRGDEAVKKDKKNRGRQAEKARQEKWDEINKEREQQKRNKEKKTTRRKQEELSKKAEQETREKIAKETREKAERETRQRMEKETRQKAEAATNERETAKTRKNAENKTKKENTKNKYERGKQTKTNELNERNNGISKARSSMARNAIGALGVTIGLGIIFGPIQDAISQKAGEMWANDWEAEARVASGVCTD